MPVVGVGAHDAPIVGATIGRPFFHPKKSPVKITGGRRGVRGAVEGGPGFPENEERVLGGSRAGSPPQGCSRAADTAKKSSVEINGGKKAGFGVDRGNPRSAKHTECRVSDRFLFFIISSLFFKTGDHRSPVY